MTKTEENLDQTEPASKSAFTPTTDQPPPSAESSGEASSPPEQKTSEPLWLVFDTETTGLPNNASSDLRDQPYVIEFAGVLINRNGDIVKEYECLFKPPVALTPKITEITGLTDSKLKDAIRFDCDAIQNLMSHEGVQAAVAHNFAFDRAMVSFEFARAERIVKWPPLAICTVEATYPILGRRMKMSQMYRHFFGEDFVGAHRAMNDVKALARCTAYMIQRNII